MKEKNLTIQSTKSLTTKKDEPKELTKKSKDTALIKTATKKQPISNETKKSKTSKSNSAESKKAKSSKTGTTSSKKSKTSSSKTSSSTKKATNKVTAKEKSLSSTNKATNQKNTAKKSSAKKDDINSYAIEYFDLPYRYNETIVKLLVQTPKRLFVYWDIADKDREHFVKLFGNNFFNETIPFLRVINESMNYSFDIEINDFANSWYININDENCKYHVELYRKFRSNNINDEVKVLIQNINQQSNNFNTDNNIFISASNEMDAPNDKVLAINYTYPRSVEYRNIKTNISSYKVIDKQPNMEFYTTFFKDENIETITNLPTSR